MDIIQLLAAVLIGVVPILILKKENREIAILQSIAVGIIICVFAISKLNVLFDFTETLTAYKQISPYIVLIFKAFGIGIITELCADFCRDAGENSIASKVEFAGKIEIIIICLPRIKEIADVALSIAGD